ncbi:MAG: heme-binding protein [Rhodospirillaceae bacterium]|jgi:uncharacterized protein GlcG (DUF336 family)|nr:heme-binding protein [Rhodospirillaceae bacterium]
MARPPAKLVASSLDLITAETIATGALAAARLHDTLPLTVAVLDSGGHLVTFKREDGCGILRADIALGKAYGALGMGMSSRTIRDALADRPAFQGAIAVASEGRFIPVPGGVTILNEDGLIIGAIGVSGDSSECDEYAAIEGITAAGLTPDPARADTSWMN